LYVLQGNPGSGYPRQNRQNLQTEVYPGVRRKTGIYSDFGVIPGSGVPGLNSLKGIPPNPGAKGQRPNPG